MEKGEIVHLPWEIDHKLHTDDLKWRSIRELTDFPEFDLIIETNGEFYYSYGTERRKKSAVKDFDEKKFVETIFDSLYEQIRIRFAKLKKGGMASIYPILFPSKTIIPKIEEKLKQEYGEDSVKMEISQPAKLRTKKQVNGQNAFLAMKDGKGVDGNALFRVLKIYKY
jgi:hydroxymethylpyrimidine pyrophosphatase-like HAD family hydrolase